MSLLDRFRADSTVRLLRSEPVLALPASLASARVLDHAREWAPRAVPVAAGVLKVDDTIELHGPVSYAEALWRQAKLPADCAVAYAARERWDESDETAEPAETHWDLIQGLCDRIGGRWRASVRKGWEDPDPYPPDPWVYAPRLLPSEEMLRLLVPLLPGATVSFDDEYGYAIDADLLAIQVDGEYPMTYPQVKLQPWFATAERLTEYEIASYDNPESVRHAARVADAIAEATGGLVLGARGFPWRRR